MTPLMLLAGAGAGAGAVLLYSGLRGPAPTLARTLALLDPPPPQPSRRAALVAWTNRQAWLGQGRQSDLRVLGKDSSWYASARSRYALAGMAGLGTLAGLASLAGLGLSPLTITIIALVGLLAGRYPAHAVPRRADQVRRDMRDELACYLELVSLGIGAGRGLTQALLAAAQVGSSPLFGHLRTALEQARMTGTPQPRALGALGRELDLPELREVAATLARATSEGSVAYDSFRARACALRDRQRTDAEAEAAASTETMTLGPYLVLLGYLLWVTYPALVAILVPTPS